jgi:hypothetical protein
MESTSKLTCPRCGNTAEGDTDGFVTVRMVPTWNQITRIEGGKILAVGYANYEEEGGTGDRIQCMTCEQDFDVPEDLEIEWY